MNFCLYIFFFHLCVLKFPVAWFIGNFNDDKTLSDRINVVCTFMNFDVCVNMLKWMDIFVSFLHHHFISLLLLGRHFWSHLYCRCQYLYWFFFFYIISSADHNFNFFVVVVVLLTVVCGVVMLQLFFFFFFTLLFREFSKRQSKNMYLYLNFHCILNLLNTKKKS